MTVLLLKDKNQHNVYRIHKSISTAVLISTYSIHNSGCMSDDKRYKITLDISNIMFFLSMSEITVKLHIQGVPRNMTVDK